MELHLRFLAKYVLFGWRWEFNLEDRILITLVTAVICTVYSLHSITPIIKSQHWFYVLINRTENLTMISNANQIPKFIQNNLRQNIWNASIVHLNQFYYISWIGIKTVPLSKCSIQFYMERKKKSHFKRYTR